MEFGYITEALPEAEILMKIYNLLLTIFYFYILNTGRTIIIRVLRKGKVTNRWNG